MADHVQRDPRPASVGESPSPDNGRQWLGRGRTFWLAVVAVYGLALLLPYLGAYPLISHEGHLAARTRELFASGGGMIPHLKGQVDLQTPPLPFWAVGVAAAIGGGIGEWTARLPQALSTIAAALLLVGWVGDWRSLRTGVLTGLIWLTSFVGIWYGRRAEPDMLLTFLTLLAFWAYWRARSAGRFKATLGFCVLVGAALGATVLIKGHHAVQFALATALVLAVADGRARRPALLAGLGLAVLVAAAVALPWFLYALHLYGQRAWTVWMHHSAGRLTDAIGSPTAWWFYLATYPALTLPWIYAVGMGIYQSFRRKLLSGPMHALLLSWSLGGLVLLTLSASRYVHYALPIAPPLFIYGGIGLDWLLFAVPRRLGRLGWATLGLHLALAPAGLAAGIWGAWQFPDVGGVLLGVSIPAAAAVAGAFLAYGLGRRGLALAVFFLAYLGGAVALAGGVQAPLTRREDTLHLAARYIARNVPDHQAAAMFCKWDPVAVFYAERRLAMLDSNSELRRWRRAHPGGVLLIKKEASLGYYDRALSVGPWETIEFLHRRLYLPRTAYGLLRVPAEPATAPAKTRASDGPAE